MTTNTRRARRWVMSSAAAFASIAWLAGGCQVQTDLAAVSGGAGGSDTPSGSGGATGSDTSGSSGSSGGAACHPVYGYHLAVEESCYALISPAAFEGCSADACPGAYECATDPSDGVMYGILGCVPEGWTPCFELEGRPPYCEGPDCFDGTLEAFCGEWDCPASLEEAVDLYEDQGVCDVIDVTIESGCGITAIRFDGGFSGSTYGYDDATGELVFASIFSDVPFGPCNESNYYAGPVFEQCDKHTQCTACGPSEQEDPAGLACRLDCDCDALEPIADPCFGPETCQCYCAKLKATEG
jgi:hypothetical protein